MPRDARTHTPTAAGPRLVRRTSRATTPPPSPASHEEIAVRAYELFEHDGRTHGHDLEHWLQAERQLVQTRVTARSARRAGGKDPS